MNKWTLGLVAACALLSACASGGQSMRDSGPDRAIGWLHGNCLALADRGVRIGTPVAVVMLGEVQQVVAAKVTGSADGSQECVALSGDRRDANLGGGTAFYRIDADAEVELGIGVVQVDEGRVLTVAELLDTNGDGRRDSFNQCTTSEGVRFSVWADEARRGTPLWSGYYYLGYDTEADCPDAG